MKRIANMAHVPDAPSGPSVLAILLLEVAIMAPFTSGCFVLTSERRNKPDASSNAVQVNASEELAYSRVFQCPDFNLRVGVENGPPRWEAVFLFYLLPLPHRFDYLSTAPVHVDVHLQPKAADVAFDPWRVFFLGLGANQVRVPPSRVWQDGKWLGTNAVAPVTLTTDTRFRLEFSDWSSMHPEASLVADYPDRDLPFRISVEGALDSGQPVPLPSLTFTPAAHIRAGFQLPY